MLNMTPTERSPVPPLSLGNRLILILPVAFGTIVFFIVALSQGRIPNDALCQWCCASFALMFLAYSFLAFAFLYHHNPWRRQCENSEEEKESGEEKGDVMKKVSRE